MRPREVAILGGGREGWHAARLRAAFRSLGLAARRLRFERCRLELGAGGPGLRLDGLDRLPGIVLVRAIPAGSFEQVTLRLGLLHALEALGVPVTNPPRAIERCVDKAAASFHLARAGLPTPPTWVVERRDEAAAVAERAKTAGELLVLKPLFGAQGKGLRLLRGPEDLPPPEAVAGVYYLQRFVGRPGAATARDFRVLVAGGEPVAAMARESASWITNVGQGGRPRAMPATGRLAELAVAATAAVGADHAGVDLIGDEAGGLQILEVNSMPAWRGLQSVAAVDVAGYLAADVARRLGP